MAAATKKQGVRDLVIAVAAILSLLATFMTLAGYGVALAMDQFGVAHETMFSSTLDLLDLSCWVVLFFFENVGRISFWKEYLRLLPNIAPGVGIGYVLLVACIGYIRYRSAIARRSERALRWANWIKPTRHDSMLRAAIKMGAYCTAVWFIFPAFCVAAMASIIVAASSLLAAPYMGFAAGNLHVSKHVIEPEQCTPIRNRARRMADIKVGEASGVNTADCVAVRTERGSYAKGRVLIATTTAILLFDPETGKAMRIPTKDAMVEAVGDLTTVQANLLVLPTRPTRLSDLPNRAAPERIIPMRASWP